MTDPLGRPTPTVEEEERYADDPDWADLAAVSEEILERRAEVVRLEAERAGVYRRLAAKGVAMAAMARKAGLSHMAVRFVLEPETKRRKPTKTRRPAKRAG